MLAHLVIATSALGLFMTGWYLLQAWVRRHSPDLPEDGDILEGKWGCQGCLFLHRCKLDEECPRDGR